jgi:hypothetical protein
VLQNVFFRLLLAHRIASHLKCQNVWVFLTGSTANKLRKLQGYVMIFSNYLHQSSLMSLLSDMNNKFVLLMCADLSTL